MLCVCFLMGFKGLIKIIWKTESNSLFLHDGKDPVLLPWFSFFLYFQGATCRQNLFFVLGTKASGRTRVRLDLLAVFSR